MNHDEYAKMRSLEDRYWWFVARRELALSLVRQHSVKDPLMLDLGCGTGAVLSELQKLGTTVGADYFDVALQFCKERNLEPLAQADAQRLPFRNEVFDCVVSLDTIEHLHDDRKSVREIARTLKPGGVFIMNVPAFSWLWGPHDVALMHYRRYTKKQVHNLLTQAGLEPVKLTYSVFLLFPVVIFRRLIEKLHRGPAKVKLPRVSTWTNQILLNLMKWEAKRIESGTLPWGSSVVAVARKPHSVESE